MLEFVMVIVGWHRIFSGLEFYRGMTYSRPDNDLSVYCPAYHQPLSATSSIISDITIFPVISCRNDNNAKSTFTVS
jgi:hypothetical protein